MRQAEELLNTFEPDIENLILTPSDGGQFEISVNDTLIYSKLKTHRHAEPGEIVRLVEKILNS